MLNMIFFQPFMFGTALAEQMGFNLIDSGYHLIEFNQVDQTARIKVALATGVMIVCTGKATKRIEEFQYHTKEYVATIRLGATTPSYDLEHEIDATYPTEHITRGLVEETLKKFIGEIQQVPPAFSACMVNGKRAYDLARKGEEVELKPKLLVIDEIELLDDGLDIAEPWIKVRVVCSKGTYIRALARDIGEALQSGAHLTALERTRVGDVRLADCLNPLDFKEWIEAQEIDI